MSTMPSRRRGFTLLELLVVVAVIGLLLAILLPALSAANEAGRAALCGANLNQLSLGSIAYSEDNDSFLPWYPKTQTRPEGGEWWVTQVARGMEAFEPKVYRCPTDPVSYGGPLYIFNGQPYMNDVFPYRTSYDASGSLSSTPNERPFRDEHAGGRTMMLQVSYRRGCDLGIALKLGPTGSDPTAIRGSAVYGDWVWFTRRTTEFTNPEKVVLMVEGHNSFQYDVNRNNQMECLGFGTVAVQMLDPKTTIYASWDRHFGTSNLSFIDGHVERLAPRDAAIRMLAWDQGLPLDKRRRIYPEGHR